MEAWVALVPIEASVLSVRPACFCPSENKGRQVSSQLGTHLQYGIEILLGRLLWICIVGLPEL